MSVQPWASFGLPWLFDVLCGMDWPQGDEDAVRRCAQAWTDAMIGLLDAGGSGNDAATRVGYSVQSVSAEAFDEYWKKYVGDEQTGDQSYLGQLARHSEQLATMLLAHSDEIEYTKIMMNIQLIMAEIQILVAIAQAFFTEGTSLLEIPIVIKIGQFVITQISMRFLVEVLQMVLPDVVAQAVMLAEGHASSWDVGKTAMALGTGVLAGKLGELGQGLVGKLPWMDKGLTATLAGRLAQFGTHMGEGALNNGLVALTTSTVPGLWSYATATPQQRAQIDLGGGPVDWENLGLQVLSGGAMSGVHHVAGLYTDHSGPVTRLQLPNGDPVHGSFTDDGSFALFGDRGYRYGTGEVAPDGTLTVHPLFGGDPHTVDLSRTPYYETTHDGTTTQYVGYGDTRLAQWEQRPGNGTVGFTATDGSTITVPRHGTVTYAPNTDHVLRAEVPQGGGVIQTWEPARHGDYAGPYEMVGRTEQSKLPGGQSTVRYFDGNDRLLATKDGWTGKTDVVHPDAFAKVFGAPPTGHGTGGGGHPPVPAGTPDERAFFMFGKDNGSAVPWSLIPAGGVHLPDLQQPVLLDRSAQRLGQIRDGWGREYLRQQIEQVRNDPTAVQDLLKRVRGYLVVLGADDIVRGHLQERYPDLYRQLAKLDASRQPWPGGTKTLLLSLPSGAAHRPVEIRSALLPHEPGNEGRAGHLGRYDPNAFPIVHLTQEPEHASAYDNALVREAVKRAGPELQARLARARNGTVADLGRVVDDAVHAGVLSAEEGRLLLGAQRHMLPDPDLLVNQLVDLHQNGRISTDDALALLQNSADPAAYHLLVDHLADRTLTPQQVADLLSPRHSLPDEVDRLVQDSRLTEAEGQRLLDLANHPAGLAAEVHALSRPGTSLDEAAALHAGALVSALDEFGAWHPVDPAGSTALEMAFHLFDDPAKLLRLAVDQALRPLVGQAAVEHPADYLEVLDALAPNFLRYPPARLPDPPPGSGISHERWTELTRDLGLRAKWPTVVKAVLAAHERPGHHSGGRNNDAETKMFALLAEAFAGHRPPPGTTIVVTADKAMCDGCRTAAQFLADRFGVDVVVADPVAEMQRYDMAAGAFLHPSLGVADGVFRAVDAIRPQPGVFDVVFHADHNGPLLPGDHVGDIWDLARLLPRESIPPDVAQIRLLACDLANNPDFLRQAREYYGRDIVAADKPVWIDLDGNVVSGSARQTREGPVPGGPYDGRWWVQDANGLRAARQSEIPYDAHAADPAWHRMGDPTTPGPEPPEQAVRPYEQGYTGSPTPSTVDDDSTAKRPAVQRVQPSIVDDQGGQGQLSQTRAGGQIQLSEDVSTAPAAKLDEPSALAHSADVPLELDPRKLGPKDLVAVEREQVRAHAELDRVRDQLADQRARIEQARRTGLPDAELAERYRVLAERERQLVQRTSDVDSTVNRLRRRFGLPLRDPANPPSRSERPVVPDRPAPLPEPEAVRVVGDLTARRDQATAELDNVRGQVALVEGELRQARDGGADPQVTDPLERRLRDLEARAAEAFDRQRDLNAELRDRRRRLGLPAEVRDMRETGDPATARLHRVQRIVAHHHEQRGEAPLGRRFAGTRPEQNYDNALLDPQVQVGMNIEIPFMNRVKRVLTLGRVLEDAVRDRSLTPLLPDELRRRIDAGMREFHESEYDQDHLVKRMDEFQRRLVNMPEYQRLDDGLRRYVHRVVDESIAEARNLPGTAVTRAPGGGQVARRLGEAVTHPVNAISEKTRGQVNVRVVKSREGGVYLEFRRMIDAISYEESSLQGLRLTVAEVKGGVRLADIAGGPGGIGAGIAMSAGAKYAFTPGREFEQKLNRGDGIAIKLSGPGPRVINSHWDRMETRADGHGVVKPIKDVADVAQKTKHTLKSDAAVSPAIFLPGLPDPLAVPMQAKVSVELSASQKAGEGWETKAELTVEFVTPVKQVGDVLGKVIDGFGYGDLRDWLGLPEWMPLEPDVSSEGGLIIGPWDLKKLAGPALGFARQVLTQQGFTLPENGLPSADDLVRQLPPAQVGVSDRTRIFEALGVSTGDPGPEPAGHVAPVEPALTPGPVVPPDPVVPPGPAQRPGAHLLHPVRDAGLAAVAGTRPVEPGYHDLVAHANGYTLLTPDPSGAGDRVASPVRLAARLRVDGLPPDVTVRLLASEVGAGGYPAALARALHQTVVATDADVFLGPDGAVVAGRVPGYVAGDPLPVRQPDGVWRAYHPDGTVEILSPDDPRVPPGPTRAQAGAAWRRA